MNDSHNEEGTCCPICLDPLLAHSTSSTEVTNESLLIGATVPCGHCFHVKCWKQSATAAARQRRSNVNNCPTCNVKTKYFMRLFLNAPGKPKPVPTAVPTARVVKAKVVKRTPTTGIANPAPSLGSSHGRVRVSTRFGTSSTVQPLEGSSNPVPSLSVASSVAARPAGFPLEGSSNPVPSLSVASSVTAQPRPAGFPAQGLPAQQGYFGGFASFPPQNPTEVHVSQPFQQAVQGGASFTAAGNNAAGLVWPTFQFASHVSPQFMTTFAASAGSNHVNPSDSSGSVYSGSHPPWWVSIVTNPVPPVQNGPPIFQIGVSSTGKATTTAVNRRRIVKARRPH